jgi:hypothetical protein
MSLLFLDYPVPRSTLEILRRNDCTDATVPPFSSGTRYLEQELNVVLDLPRTNFFAQGSYISFGRRYRNESF